MSALPEIASHWFRQTDKGKGVRLDAGQMDLLNAIGVGQLIAEAMASYQREQCQKRTMRSQSMPAADTGSYGTEEEMERFEPRTSRSYGMTTPQDVTAASRRAQRTSRPQKTN